MNEIKDAPPAKKVSRRDVLKLLAAVVGANALNKTGIDKFLFGKPTSHEGSGFEADLFDENLVVDIPEIVNLDEPIPDFSWLYLTNWKKRFPKDKLEQYEREARSLPYYEPLGQMTDHPQYREFLEYSREKLPPKRHIPKEILFTPAGGAIKPNEVELLLELKESEATPKQKFQEVLRLMPPITFEDMFPIDAIGNGRSGERSQKLWQRLEKVSEIIKDLEVFYRAMGYALREAVGKNPNNPGIEALKKASKDVNDKMWNLISEHQNPIVLELVARTSNTHLLLNSKIWPNSEHILKGLIPNNCFGFVARIIDIMSWINDDTHNSPIVGSSEGAYLMRDAKGLKDDRFSDANFFKYIELHHQEMGWENVTDCSFTELIRKSEGHFFVVLRYNVSPTETAEPYPEHSYILHTVPEYPNVLMKAVLNGTAPSGSLYEPSCPGVNEENYQSKHD